MAALEDKIVQKAVTEIILTPIYEPAFLGFSYGFRAASLVGRSFPGQAAGTNQGKSREAYAGAEGVAVRTTFRDLQESIRSVAEPPVTFGQVGYVDYLQQEVSRFGWAQLFNKGIEYRGEEEVRALLPSPPREDSITDPKEPEIRFDPDVAEQRGRYVSVDLDILVKEVVVSPQAAPWFAEVMKSVMRRSAARASVTPSAI